MYYVVRCIDFDKPQSVLQVFSSRCDAEEFALFRRRDEKDDHVRYLVTDSYSFACPIIEGQPLRFSVGYYRGRRRVVLAWFADYSAALDYLARMVKDSPQFRVDILQSMF